MARADDLGLLKVYTDPTLSTQDKLRLLQGGADTPAPPEQPDMRVAGPGGGEFQDPYTQMPQAPASPAPTYADGYGAPVNPTDPGRPTHADFDTYDASAEPIQPNTGIVSGIPEQKKGHISTDDKPLFDTRGFSAGPKSESEKPDEHGAEPPESAAVEGEEPGAAPQRMTSEQRRESLARAGLLLNAPGKVVPTESVHKQETVQHGVLSPDEAKSVTDLAMQSANAQVEQAQLQMAQDNRVSAENLQAARAGQVEADRMAKIREQTMQFVQQKLARQDQLSQEIANEKPEKSSLWAGKNFGESLLTAIGLALFGAGSGATRTASDIVPTITALANRQVDEQKRRIAMKQGQIDALGTVVERHLSNLNNLDLASKQARADIMAQSAVRVQEMMQDPAYQGPVQQAKLRQMYADLTGAAVKLGAEVKQQFGDHVTNSMAEQFVQKRVIPPTPEEKAAADAKIAAGLNQVRAQTQPNVGPPAVQMGPDGRPVVSPEAQAAAQAHAPAPSVPPAAQSPAKPAASANTRQAALERAAQLQSQGHSDAAIAALPPADRAAVKILLKEASKEKRFEGDPEAALEHALNSYLAGSATSSQPVVSAADEGRVVVLKDGTRLRAGSPEEARETQKSINNIDPLIGNLHRILSLGESGGRTNPKNKATIENLAGVTLPMLKAALGAGTRNAGEADPLAESTGKSLASYIQNPTTDNAAALRSSIQTLTMIRSRMLGNLTDVRTGEQYRPYRTR